MFIRKTDDGKYYVCRRYLKNNTKKGKFGKAGRDWFLIKRLISNEGYLDVGMLTFPKELIGKRIKLKVIIIKKEK